MEKQKEPSLKNLTKANFGEPPATQNEILQQLGQPHVSSFNYMLKHGIKQALEDLIPVEFALNGDRIKIAIVDSSFSCPLVPQSAVGVRSKRILPAECRQRAATYKGRFLATISWSINGVEQTPFQKDMGELPIMVKSSNCHLSAMSPKQLVEAGEHEDEWGGYFIVKGHERLIRMLQMTRRNFPIAVRRSGWKARGALFSDYGVTIRCVREDQTATTNVLHFVTDGTAMFMFSHKKSLYFTPLVLILKCLCDYCDHYVYQKLVEGHKHDSYYIDCVQNMLQELHVRGLHTHADCKAYLGRMFRVKFSECPEWSTDSDICDFILKKCVLIHLPRFDDKFNLLAFMAQKLFVFAQDKCKAEGVDAVMMQELLLGGHLYLQILKEKLQVWLASLKFNMIKLCKNVASGLDEAKAKQAAKRSGGVEYAFGNFLATGNLSSQSGLGLMQDKGLTIVAENINRMRYMSHFKAVHRGAFFQEMRTTEVRRLLGDDWGFKCPVHTPDGAPCGLLNHLTQTCTVTDVPDPDRLANIIRVLSTLGIVGVEYATARERDVRENYVVMLDGKVLGYVNKKNASYMVYRLRTHKANDVEVPKTMEIVFVPISETGDVVQYPGIYLFTGPARMMRPVMNLSTKTVELVGTFEQIYLDICVSPNEFYKGVTTHQELSKLAILSNLAKLIPMPDCNQSPRNMYQCQMGKQTMGTPCLNWSLQSESKLYRLQTPASPLFRPRHYDDVKLDDFAMGTNAIVAVISYTGYDMEDAMIINKMSEERGLAHGSIYKSEFVTLDDATSYFCRDPDKKSLADFLDADGLPFVGRKMKPGEPLYSYYSSDQSQYRVCKFQGKEECYVDSVKLCGSFETQCRTACLTFRVPRNPTVGDKFASRAGQKGICSMKWPMEDLPFTETGLVPDIVFNPHGFPSRMTIAMMIEIMAGKSAALHGLVHDATPFRFNESQTAIDYFGRLLEAGGYNYYGTETMYSGIDGREMTAHIFFGVVYYQRLRHMVSDKWQVRSTGPCDILTRQPLKGRKRGGGVRFGEMERDCLLSHGASFLLQDRLLHCSDKTSAYICTKCDSILGPITIPMTVADKPNLSTFRESCRLCGESKNVAEVQIPYILKYLVAQLASCNINTKLKTVDV